MLKKRVRMPDIASIVARSFPDKIIGIDNQLPWHLSTDLKMFKRRTANHAVIMGRKTFESIGRPLPNRTNIVLSRNNTCLPSGVLSASNPETALLLADIDSIYRGNTKFFVIGGEQIYKLFEEFINVVDLTEVFCGPINGDAKFEIDFQEKVTNSNKPDWFVRSEVEFPKSESDEFPFRVTRFARRKPNHRFRISQDFLKSAPNIDDYFDQYELALEKNEAVSEQLALF